MALSSFSLYFEGQRFAGSFFPLCGSALNFAPSWMILKVSLLMGLCKELDLVAPAGPFQLELFRDSINAKTLLCRGFCYCRMWRQHFTSTDTFQAPQLLKLVQNTASY